MSLSTFSVLLIDDDEDDYVNIRDILDEIQRNRIQLIWKNSYKDGLESLKSSSFDACLLDYRLGERTGLELLRECRTLGIACPFIFLTGMGDFDLDLQAMQTGASDYLVKGQLTAPLLERSIRYAIKHAHDLEEIVLRQENFRILFNSTFEGILVHQNGIIRDVNSAAGDIFGLMPGEMMDRTLLDFIHADFHGQVESKYNSNDPISLEVMGITAAGTDLFLKLSSRRVVLKGQTMSLIAVTDLTSRKNMEAQIIQQDRLASLGLLASSLAHEIGTPLGIIRSRAELVEKKASENPKVKQDMGIIVSQIDKISKLVQSLLYLAREKKTSAGESVNLFKVIQEIMNLVQHELDRKGIRLRLDVDEQSDVQAEAAPLGQVLLNLLVNAIQAIEEARLRPNRQIQDEISMTAKKTSKFVELSIQDTGCGISEKNQAQLFKPFFTTKDVGIGTGLGLATSYKIIQSWGGSIRVESGQDQGATFTMKLLETTSRGSL